MLCDWRVAINLFRLLCCLGLQEKQGSARDDSMVRFADDPHDVLNAGLYTRRCFSTLHLRSLPSSACVPSFPSRLPTGASLGTSSTPWASFLVLALDSFSTSQ